MLFSRKVDVRPPGKGNSNSHGARPVHLIITMIKWIRTSGLSIKNYLWHRGRSMRLNNRGQFAEPCARIPQHGNAAKPSWRRNSEMRGYHAGFCRKGAVRQIPEEREHQHSAVLCFGRQRCVVLCCVVLCCGVVWCGVLCCVVLCCAVLCCAVLCCVVVCCAVLCSSRNKVGAGDKPPSATLSVKVPPLESASLGVERSMWNAGGGGVFWGERSRALCKYRPGTWRW